MGLSKIVLILGGIWLLYSLIKKPEYVAIFLFTLIVADVNMQMSPLNLRALVTFALFVRIMMNPENDHPAFFSNGYARHVVFFFVYVALVSQLNNTLKLDTIKELLLDCLSAFLGYYYYYKTKSFYHLKMGIIFGGLICFGDLAYTYATQGQFPVIRLHFFFTGEWEYYNHNFFGYVCGVAFVFLLSDYLNRSTPDTKWAIFVMPVMFLGVLLSTSRAALLAMIIMAIVLIGKGLSSRKSGKRAYTIITVTLVCIFLSVFLFQILTMIIGIKSDFMTTVTARLIDEPIAMFNKMMGNRYDIGKMDSMEWREEASSLAFKYFMNMPATEQLLGIGYYGFLIRDIGQGLDAHNGLLLLLIETGVLGFIIYFSLIFTLWMRVRSLKLSSAAFSCVVYIILYVTSHNKEATAFLAFLIIGSLIGELRYKGDLKKEGIEEEEMPALAGTS